MTGPVVRATGGVKWSVKAIGSSALATGPVHTAAVSSATVTNHKNTFVTPGSTPCDVPDSKVTPGGPVGLRSTHGTKCGSHLNEVGTGLVFNVVVIVDAIYFVK